MMPLITQGFIEIILLFLTGLVMGSFANVCIHRIPKGESIIFPNSHCPHCHHALTILENIPLVSFVVLRGRCHYCQERISWRYPVVEFLTGLLYLTMLARFGFSISAFVYMAFGTVLIIVSFIDLKEKIIPDELSLPGAAIGLILSAFLLPVGFLNALIGMAFGGGILLFIAFISKGGMGGGDVKLMAMIGAFLGWPDVVVSLFVAVLIGSLVGVLLVLLRIKGRKDAVPFGPFLALGAIISTLYGPDLIMWYLSVGWSFQGYW